MVIVLVDEDKSCLDVVERSILDVYTDSKIVNFTNSDDALKYIEKNRVDIVFTETYVKKINGLLLAKKVREINREIYVVFITNTKEYAMEAWRLSVKDYILKPIEHNRIDYILHEKRERMIN